MSNGIEMRRANGAVFFSTDSVTWNYIGTFTADANVDAYGTFPALSIMTEVLIQRSFVDAPPANQEAYLHSVSVNSSDATRVDAIHGTGLGTIKTRVVVLAR